MGVSRWMRAAATGAATEAALGHGGAPVVRGETVTHILVTHTHIDHVPATPALVWQAIQDARAAKAA